jgi:hypothetical protein
MPQRKCERQAMGRVAFIKMFIVYNYKSLETKITVLVETLVLNRGLG